uniref:Putative mitsugumin 29 n=1 Tax=Ixodes ricinus TaxID=34613 RepID=V5GJ29_IXORI
MRNSLWPRVSCHFSTAWAFWESTCSPIRCTLRTRLCLSFDLGLSALLALFWFAGSCAWAQGKSDVKYYTSLPNFKNFVDVCKYDEKTCEPETTASFATLNVSLILGFFNVLLWVAGCWFVFKETSFHAQAETKYSSS